MALDSANRTGRTVVGLFRNRGDAEQAISDLKDAGFTREQIGIAIKDRNEQRDLAEGTDTSAAGKGALAGAVSGGLVGGIIGLLGSLLIPGLGPIVVGGVLESVLVGAGAATGGLIGALVGLGVSEEDAKHFDAGFREGGTLVTVDAGSRVDEAEGILGACNADLGPRWAARSAGVGTRARDLDTVGAMSYG
ncbi:MAG: general stress protein, partial [Gemmatimonadales bacterium]